MIDIQDLDIDELEQLRDACNRRIMAMRQTKNLPLTELLRLLEEVKVVLTDQHKEWFSLERWQWMEGEVRFWLNPKEQDIYNAGWFSIDDLIAWTHDNGPIVVEPEFDEEDAETNWQDNVQMAWQPAGYSAETEHNQNVLLQVM